MGAVYRARRILLGDEVAIKVILGDCAERPGPRERFLRESRACAQPPPSLDHRSSIFDYNADDPQRRSWSWSC